MCKWIRSFRSNSELEQATRPNPYSLEESDTTKPLSSYHFESVDKIGIALCDN